METKPKFIVNDNPKTYWIILKDEIEENCRKVPFNSQTTDEEQPFHLYKTRKWARKVARETCPKDSLIYRTIIPVNGRYYLWGEKEIYAKDILIKNDKIYNP